MAEKRKYLAGINRKGLDNSVTEEQARHMATHQGNTYLFIVAAHAGPKTVGEDGSENVSLIPDLVELVPAEHEARVRDLQRAFYLARPEQFGQAPFEGTGDEPSVDSALQGTDAIIERDEAGDPAGVWDGSTDDDGSTPGDVPDPQGEAAPKRPCPSPGCSLDEHETGAHVVGSAAAAKRRQAKDAAGS